MTFHLAQLNIAYAKTPMDDPLMEDFNNQLDTINALAEASPGFVWRLQDETGDATSIQAFEDPRMLVNMSVWESLESLRHYVYKTAHQGVMKDRRRWFEPDTKPHMVLWWLPVDQLPTIDHAKQKLTLLTESGPSAEAFTFAKPFAMPG